MKECGLYPETYGKPFMCFKQKSEMIGFQLAQFHWYLVVLPPPAETNLFSLYQEFPLSLINLFLFFSTTNRTPMIPGKDWLIFF